MLKTLDINPQVLFLTLTSVFQIVKTWWWIILPFIFWGPFLWLWKYWRQEIWDASVKKVMLEIKIPEEVLKPIKAMEQVFAGFHGIHDVLNWRERWLEGQFQLAISLEIASIDGEVHFYIRTPEMYRKIIESNIYSQYPEAEISVADDYAKKVPQDIPNKDWDLFGFDMINSKPDPYPIKTYKEFEPEGERITKEEKRVDPLAGLLEGMATLNPGEQLWLQIIARPVREEIPWMEEGKKEVQKLMGKVKPSMESFPQYAIKGASRVLIAGKPLEEAKLEEEKLELGALRLSPGEVEIIKKIQEKIGKFGFVCNIRFIYLGKQDVFFKPITRVMWGFFKEVSTENLGGLKPWIRTMPKIQWVFRSRRTYLRKRRLFRCYLKRFTPLWPRQGWLMGKTRGTYVLNTEELATLYHFPGRIVAPAPGIPRVAAKKGEAPPELPVE